MALELIGGSILSALIEVLVDRLASREVLGFFKSHKLDGGLLAKLKETLNTVNGLLEKPQTRWPKLPPKGHWRFTFREHQMRCLADIREERSRPTRISLQNDPRKTVGDANTAGLHG
ncbi:hypothetical protein NC653_037342 [Populus alba x Populus x berolinensis]|uniref:Rx N-terminal domain-containing protein n=1 Tax=Populus alba x Populus x berolinensis TaxID=444605 RepID=A0AAD6LES0_9ROSI|nr:hypothetical protein NC653_037342 [Populus alba x Populus x berolinensis]